MSETKRGRSITRLVDIMRTLLSPDGCPWDREQTLETLRAYVIEEAFEVVEAIDARDPVLHCEELGDLMLQIVFQSELAERAGNFHLDDAIQGICEKLIRRHPHVFGAIEVSGSEEVLQNWEAIKAKEKAGRGTLDGVPVALPALMRAWRIGEKAARVGYDWPDEKGVRAKITEELAELDEARKNGDRRAEEHELGDVLFALASWARKRDIDPEAALRGTLDRFSTRFRHVENDARERGESLRTLTPEELDRRWEDAKRALADSTTATHDH